MTLADVACIGAVAGLHAATWGAYKDAPYEGFRPFSYVRSIVLAAIVAVGLSLMTTLDTAGSPLVLLGAIYAIERLGTEWWKAIIRNDDQSAYDIPMRLGYRGRPVRSPTVRYVTGGIVVAALVLGCWSLTSVQDTIDPPAWAIIVLGGVGGWLTAVGGAWKDAPIEGFGAWKFLRSPAVATGWAAVLFLVTDNWIVLAFSAAGFAVASIETYKTHLTNGRPPGKFATKPVRFQIPHTRRLLMAGHAATWATLALAVILLPGSSQRSHAITAVSPQLTSLVVASFAALAAALVVAAAYRPGRCRRTTSTVPAGRTRLGSIRPHPAARWSLATARGNVRQTSDDPDAEGT